jgi:hypothetical protein
MFWPCALLPLASSSLARHVVCFVQHKSPHFACAALVNPKANFKTVHDANPTCTTRTKKTHAEIMAEMSAGLGNFKPDLPVTMID